MPTTPSSENTVRHFHEEVSKTDDAGTMVKGVVLANNIATRARAASRRHFRGGQRERLRTPAKNVFRHDVSGGPPDLVKRASLADRMPRGHVFELWHDLEDLIDEH